MSDPRIDAVQAWLQREDGRLGDIFGLWTQGKRDDGWVADRLVTEGHLAALVADVAPPSDPAAPLREAAGALIDAALDVFPENWVAADSSMAMSVTMRGRDVFALRAALRGES